MAVTRTAAGVIVCDSDTENDDTLMSTRSQHATTTSSTAAQLDKIDSDSDFEVSSRPRVVKAPAAARQDRVKYYTCLQ